MGSDEESGGGRLKEKEKEESLSSACSVCGSPAAAHLHYGAVSCYSCRAFFRRGQPKQVRCIFGHGQCKISRHNRTNCKLCRYRRCLEVGMKPEKVDFYLNKRKEREKEKGREEEVEAGSSGTRDVEQLPNRSPASEESIRTRVSPSPDIDPLEIKKEEPVRYSPDYYSPASSGGYSGDWPAHYPDWSGLWRPRPVKLSAASRAHHQGFQTSVITSHAALKRETESSSSEDETGRNVEDSRRHQNEILQPYTSVIKRNTEISMEKPRLHPVVNFRQSEIPGPIETESYGLQNDEGGILHEIKSESLKIDMLSPVFSNNSLEVTNEQDSQSYKIVIPKRRVDLVFESDEEEEEKPNETMSIVPLKKRQRMMEVPYAIGHAINKKVNPVMSFTFEEEFKVMDYIVRIEQYQNRRFEFVESQFPRYREMCAGIIHYAAVGKKIPYNYNIDQTLFRIGLDFTKRACVEIYEEMGLLSVDVRREILNSTYPALYVVMYSIMEGNTRENTWVDQQMKTLHVTKENHSSMLPLTQALQSARALSLKDQEKFTSPWAVTDLDEEKFEKTISYLGRLLRDDIQLQALYHMLVMLSPCSANSSKIQHNKALLSVQREVANLMYRYLCTSTTMHYSKTGHQADNTLMKEESSSIMKLSEGIEDLCPADKTELLLGLIPDLHDCVDIMHNRRILVQLDPDI